MKINDRFSLTSDKYQWILIERYEGKDKDGNPKQNERQYYYPNLKQVANKLLDIDCKEYESFQELLDMLERASLKIELSLAEKA